MGLLDDKTIVVTGAAQGMGANHARRCVEEGAFVVLTDIQKAEGESMAESLGEAACFVEHDVTSEADWVRVAEVARVQNGHIDGLVNNAAIHGVRRLLDETAVDLLRMFEINVVGSWQGVRQMAPIMRDAGGGSIVNISSTVAMGALPHHGSYGASKWAIRGMSKIAASELGEWNIRVNTVHPGPITETGMFVVPEESHAAIFSPNPISRPATRDDVSNVVLFLLSDLAGYVTGHEHVVDGGGILV